MKKNAMKYGLIAGLVVSVLMLINISWTYTTQNHNLWLGYASMLIAFSFIFIGVKNYRDNQLNGFISFGKAFKLGFFITLLASTLYVITWLIDYYVFIPDFMDKFVESSINEIPKNTNATEVSAQIEELNSMKELYKNPLMVVLFTYLEILPVGLLVSFICALILKRKDREAAIVEN